MSKDQSLPAAAASPQPCAGESLYEFEGRSVFYELDGDGNMTGRMVSYPAGAVDEAAGTFDQSRMIVWPDASTPNPEVPLAQGARGGGKTDTAG